MTVWPALRRRVRMLPPILPRPTSPMCMAILSWVGLFQTRCRSGAQSGQGSGQQATRHQQVAEARDLVLAGAADHHRLGRLGEGELDRGLVDRRESVEEELRVEARGELLAVDVGLDRLRRLCLLAGPGVEREDALGELQLDG